MDNLPQITKEQREAAIQDILGVLKPTMPKFTEKFRAPCTTNNFYPAEDNIEWTDGFYTGIYWLAYEATKEDLYKDSALVQVDSFLERIQKRVMVDHHDMGFLYTPSCVAAYKLTGSETAKEAAILAADNLISRFHEKGQFIQAWGELGAKDNYRMIIDCLLNLPLLYWATEVTGNSIYKEKADAHAKTALKNLVRDDYSTYHTFFFDPETGVPVKGVTAQGYRDGSAWARGQAWGIYGLALLYRYTQNAEAIDLFYPVTDFFIERLPADGVPYWDMDFTAEDNEPRDSSASAIAACGMLEMAKYLPDGKAAYYTQVAKQIAGSLAENYAVKSVKDSDGLLLHGVYAKSSEFNTVSDYGVDECNTWGDYFWFELLTRLEKDWNLYW